jgi:hypothetical protein
MNVKNVLTVKRGNDDLSKIKVKRAQNTVKGEVNVFIDAAREMTFDKVRIQRPNKYRDFDNVRACSWHGYYENKDDRTLRPVINLKDKEGNKIIRYKHDGTINQDDVFLFPIFSIYIPKNLESKRRFSGTKNSHEIVLKSMAVRLDFFLLPKHVTKQQFMRLTISAFYLNYDISMFNRQMRGALHPLTSDINRLEFKWFRFDRWDSFVRSVYTPADLTGYYAVYFHDTFNPIGCILDRGYSPPAKGLLPKEYQPVAKSQFRELHEKELRELGL